MTKPKPARHRILVYADAKREWRWTRIAGNGEQVSASTEGYDNKQFAIQQARDLNSDVPVERVNVVDDAKDQLNLKTPPDAA